MISIAISVLVVSGVGAAMAAVLVLAERVIANYGPCEITVNGEKNLTLQGGGSLLEALTADKIFIPSACGGRGTCGYCKLKVLEGGGPFLPTEAPFVETKEREAGMRLSCQVKVRNDLRIEIPPDLFAVREFTCVCEAIRDLTYDIKEFRFALKEPSEIDYTPGQYMQLLAPPYRGSREEVYRAYSMSSDPADRGRIELIVRLVPGGICTTYCFEHLKEGDPVKVNGPYGEFGLSGTDAPIVFVAGGSGMAPIKCILHHMENTGCGREATYFFGVNALRDLFMVDEMKAFEKALPAFRFIPVVARPEEGANWKGDRGLVTEAVDRYLQDGALYEAYLCGSPGMIDATIEVLARHGVPPEKIYFDKFA